MSQIVGLPYDPSPATEPLSQRLNRHFLGLARRGVQTGMKVSNGSSGKISISAGSLMTQDGCTVRETADVSDANTTDFNANASVYDRWDGIVCRHAYQTISPMPVPQYLAVEGTPGTPPDKPALGSNDTLLAYGLMRAGESSYERFVHPIRHLEGWPVVLVGDGDIYMGPVYNGVSGLLDAIDDYQDLPVIIRPMGLFEFDSSDTLYIPSETKVQGFGTETRLFGANPIHFKSSGGIVGCATIAGTNRLTCTGVDFRDWSKLSMVQIVSGADAGDYSILQTKNEELVLDLDGGVFVGDSCSIYIWCKGSELSDCCIETNSSLIDQLSLSGKHMINCRVLRNEFKGACQYPIHCDESDMVDVLIVRNRIRESNIASNSRAIVITGTPSRVMVFRVENNNLGGKLLYNTVDEVIIRGNLGDVSDTGTNSGDDTYPFNQEHSVKGEHDLDSWAGSGLGVIGGALQVKADEDSLTVYGDEIQVKAGGIKASHLAGDRFSLSGNAGSQRSVGAGGYDDLQSIKVNVPANKTLYLLSARYHIVNTNLRLRVKNGSTTKWTSADSADDTAVMAEVHASGGTSATITLGVQVHNTDSSSHDVNDYAGWHLEFLITD